MKIYTSYFAQLRNFPPNLIGLSTAYYNPRWRKMGKDKRGIICIDCPPFKPGRECEGLCNGSCNPKHPQDCAFLKAYKAQLDRLNINSILEKLGQLGAQITRDEGLKDVDFAFLFFEKYDNPCSERWPVQQWFKEHGVEVKEWQPKGE